jgi:hypothetical protein
MLRSLGPRGSERKEITSDGRSYTVRGLLGGGGRVGACSALPSHKLPPPRGKLLDQIRHHAQMMHAGLPHIYFPIDFDTSGDPWLQVGLRIGMLAQVLSLTHAFAKQKEGLPQVATPGYNLM